MKNTISVLTRSGILSIMLVAFFSATCFAQQDGKPTISKSFTVNQAGMLEVRTSGGQISVEGQSGNQVKVEMFVKKNGKLLSGSDPFMDEIEEGYEIQIEKQGNKVIASAKRTDKGRQWNQVGISFHVQVPNKMETDLHTSGGRISLSGTEGDSKVHTSGGSITMAHIDGDMDVHTSGGRISIEDADGNIDAHTSGGAIKLTDINGRVDARTSGGSIDISGTANYVKASTSGGHIKVDVQKLSKGLYLNTSGGHISANIPGADGLDLDLYAQRVSVDLQNFSGQKTKQKVVGSINGGGIPVHMHTSGGSIDISY